MKKFLKQFYIISLLVLILIFPYFVFADNGVIINLQNAGSAGYNITEAEKETSLATILGSIAQIVFSLLGIIFIVLIIYAGFNWMTAGGDEGKIEIAKKTLSRAIIGLIILVSSVAIWAFVARVL